MDLVRQLGECGHRRPRPSNGRAVRALSLFAPAAVTHSEGAGILDDDRMRLSSWHRASSRTARKMPRLFACFDADRRPDPPVQAGHSRRWRNRGAMMFRSDFFATARDYARTRRDPCPASARRFAARPSWRSRGSTTKKLTEARAGPRVFVPVEAASHRRRGCRAGGAARASAIEPVQVAALNREATLVADADAVRLVVDALHRIAPDAVGIAA
jgi:hypothetical protein